MLSCILRQLVYQVAMIGVDSNLGVEEHRSVLLKNFNHAEHLLLNGGVVLLR